MACNSAFVSLSCWNAWSEGVINFQVVLVRGSSEKSSLNGSYE